MPTATLLFSNAPPCGCGKHPKRIMQPSKHQNRSFKALATPLPGARHLGVLAFVSFATAFQPHLRISQMQPATDSRPQAYGECRNSHFQRRRLRPLLGFFGVRGPAPASQLEDLERIIHEIDDIQTRAFQHNGILGHALPESVLDKLAKEGRYGVDPEREELKKVREAGPRESRSDTLASLRLRVDAKRLRAEADLAAIQLANSRLNSTTVAELKGVDLVRELLGDPRESRSSHSPSVAIAIHTARMAFASILGVYYAKKKVASRPEEMEEAIKSQREEGVRPDWVKEEDWDEDMPNLSAANAEVRSGEEHSLEDARRRVLRLQTPPLETSERELGQGRENKDELKRIDNETYYDVVLQPGHLNVNMTNGLVGYELEGDDTWIPGLPEVKMRRVRRRQVDVDEQAGKAVKALQQLLEQGVKLEAKDNSSTDILDFMQIFDMKSGKRLNDSELERLQSAEQDMKIKDRILEEFLVSYFETEQARPQPEIVWQTLVKEVFGKQAGGAFSLQYVVDFDQQYHVLCGEIGKTPTGGYLSLRSLRTLLEKRLEYFGLGDKLSLFFLRFPPASLFEIEDIVMDAAINLGVDPDEIRIERERGPTVDDLGDDIQLADLKQLGRFIPGFVEKVFQGRFAILALSKQTDPEDTTPLDDPIVKTATVAMGSVLQLSQTLRCLSPPLFDRLDADLPDFLSHAREFPAVTQGAPQILGPYLLLILTHELGHSLASRFTNTRIGSPVPLLNPWMGYQLSLTPLRAHPATRSALFDLTASGPLLGSFLSYITFAAGLWLTKLRLVPNFAPSIPLLSLKSSIFVAQVTNAILPGAFAVIDPQNAALTVHPLALAGLWGVTFNALSLLPLGRLDGARMVEALMGKRAAQAASSFTFWGTIAAGIWDNRPDLLFAGLLIRFFWFRKNMPCRDEVSEPGGERWFLGVAALMLFLGALLPATDLFGSDEYLLENL